MYRIVHDLSSMDKKTKLLKQSGDLFLTDDLALIWGIQNRNTLRVTIRRYIQDGTLISIRRGLYSVAPLSDLDPFLLGTSYVKGFCYLSLQTILFNAGLINQSPKKITLIGGRTQEFEISDHSYLCKKMKSEYLNNQTGIDIKDGFAVASPERAAADMLYFNPHFHFDSPLDEEKIEEIKEEVFS